MRRRLELGPLIVALGAALLIVSLSLDWFEGGLSAWSVFEVWDLVLAMLAVTALVVAAGLFAPEIELLESGALPFVVGAVIVIVVSQIIDPPPAAGDQSRAIGCWLALGSAALLLAGTVLTLSRVSFAVSVEGRDTRRHVSAVDAREPPSTEPAPLLRRPPVAEPAAPEEAAEPEPPADAPATSASSTDE